MSTFNKLSDLTNISKLKEFGNNLVNTDKFNDLVDKVKDNMGMKEKSEPGENQDIDAFSQSISEIQSHLTQLIEKQNEQIHLMKALKQGIAELSKQHHLCAVDSPSTPKTHVHKAAATYDTPGTASHHHPHKTDVKTKPDDTI